jgi:hypothetical protein
VLAREDHFCKFLNHGAIFFIKFQFGRVIFEKKISVLDQGPDGSVSESVKYAARPG